ncbi:AMP-binding enzyme [Penicillium canescens]|nr:AMP-binding enzyme [Penicillium canescens]KAJ6080705.1 AMP-binding enzyme [Penicillium canescens]KAJ6177503.1 AMP-binding enzyme [Penicillium canescens]
MTSHRSGWKERASLNNVRNEWSRILTQPKLGLSEADADMIFNTADAIIHNGPEVSYPKSYRSLKAANFEATSNSSNRLWAATYPSTSSPLQA